MPAKSFKFMQMMARNKSKKNGAGPSKEVAEEIVKKTSKFDKSKFLKKKG